MFHIKLALTDKAVVNEIFENAGLACDYALHITLYSCNSNFTNFLHSDWLFARLYTSIKAVRKNTRFSSENSRDVT